MSFDLSSITKTGDNPKPPIMTIHGIGKIGKTTFASQAPSPIFIRTEDGTDNVNVDAFPLAQSFNDVLAALTTLYQEDHNFKTLVVDSLDWMEPLIWQHVCDSQKPAWPSIEYPGYGKGYVEAAAVWRRYLGAINKLRDDKGMAIVQIAHNHIKRFDPPESEPYDRYVIKMHQKAADLVVEDSDIVGFANFRVFTSETDVGFGNKKTRAMSNGERVLYTEKSPAYIAGNRYGMPPELPLEWNAVAQTIPYFNKQKKD